MSVVAGAGAGALLAWWLRARAMAVPVQDRLRPLGRGAPRAPVLVRLDRVPPFAGRRSLRMQREVPRVLHRVADELRAGATVDAALGRCTALGGVLTDSLAGVAHDRTFGAPLVDALARWAGRVGFADARVVAGALAVASTMGGPSAAALDGCASSFEDRLAVSAEARALSTQARLSAWVVGLGPVAFLLFAAGTDHTTLRVLVATTAGRWCLVLGLGFEALAALWMRRIVGGVDR
ncbi:MAG: type II secretion system F family protein [Acidimicrobiia bacterium]